MRRRVQSPESPIFSKLLRASTHALFGLSLTLGAAACGEDNQGTDTTINDRDTSGDTNGQANWLVVFVEPAAGTLLSQLDPFTLRARIEPRSSGETINLIALSASIAIDGVADPSHQELGVSSGILTRDLKLSPGAHTITLTVSNADASASADLAVVINTPPDSPTVGLSSDAPGAAENVVATATGPADTTFKAPTTELAYSYVWKKVDAADLHNGATLPATATEPGDTWEVTVTADDGFGPGLATVKRVTIGNSAPSCDGLVLLPASARTTQDITCKCLGWKDADGDGDQSTCVFTDTVSGETLGTDGACTLPASLTASGMSITCTLTPFDGATSGAAVQTASGGAVSIVNSPPSTPVATLTPSTADANTTLSCAVATPGVDPDNDPLTHTVAWTVEGSATTATDPTLVPSAAGAGKGDEVCCLVTAGDGSDSSPSSAPACVTLDNAGPTMESVFLQTQAGTFPATRADTLVCAPQQALDPDGDALTWTYTWQVAGQVVANQTGATLSAAGLALGAAVSCTAKACDADGACTDVLASKNTLVIANALPTLSGVTIPDADGKAAEEDVLTCTYTGWSDVDGDPEQVTYTWLLIAADGTVSVIPNATGPTFTITGAIVPGTKLQCTATPMNGTSAGTTVTSANQILVNAPIPVAAVVAITAPNGASGDATCTVTTPAKWLPANAVATYYWSINGAAEAARPATLTAAQVSDCDLLKCRLVYTAPGLDLPSNTASTQLAVGKDCEDGNPCTTHSCFAAGGCNAVPQDGSSCDDGDPCTENELCDNGACVGTQDVCVEDRLTVAASASRPYLAANGASGYVTTWYDNTRNASVLRETDADESRVESELQVLPAGITRPLGAFQHAVSPSGFIGVARADNMPTVVCNCVGNYTFGVNFKRYAPDMKTFDEVSIGTFGSGVQCFGSCLNRIYENRAESVAFSDDAFGTMHAYQFYIGNGINKVALVYRLVGSNLATSAAVTLVPAAEMYSMERWDAELVPDGSDQFVVAWLGVDGKSVMAQRFSREGVPQYASPITVGTSTGFLNRVAVAAMPNGRFVVAWEGLGVDSGGTGIAVQRVDETGNLLGSAVIVAPTQAGDQTLGNIAAFDTFTFVVGFRDASAPTATYRARLFSSSAVAGTTITLNEATTTAAGSAPTVEVLSDGDWVAAWVDGSEVLWTRRYHADGIAAPRAAEFRANDEATNAQESPSAAATTSGNVLVAYASKVFASAALGTEIVTRVFDPSGLEVTPETIVNEVQGASQTTPVVAAGADRFVVVWNSEEQDGSVDGLFAKLFDEDGAALSPTSFGVTLKTDSYQRQPAVAMTTGGTWVAAWNGYTDATAQSDVYMRVFPVSGDPSGEIVVNTTTTNVQEKPAVAVVPFANEVVVAWQSRSAATGYDIMVRKFGLDGVALTSEMMVNTTTTGDQRNPAIAISQSGSFVVCWESVGQVTAGKAAVACQRLRTLNLVPQGSEYLPLSATNDQLNPQLRYQSNGRLAIAYQALAVDSAGYGLQLVRVNDLGTRVAPTVTANRYWTSDQTRPWLIPMDDRLFVGWQSEGQDGSLGGVYFRILPQR